LSFQFSRQPEKSVLKVFTNIASFLPLGGKLIGIHKTIRCGGGGKIVSYPLLFAYYINRRILIDRQKRPFIGILFPAPLGFSSFSALSSSSHKQSLKSWASIIKAICRTCLLGSCCLHCKMITLSTRLFNRMEKLLNINRPNWKLERIITDSQTATELLKNLEFWSSKSNVGHPWGGTQRNTPRSMLNS